jgi:hypothetical protein
MALTRVGAHHFVATDETLLPQLRRWAIRGRVALSTMREPALAVPPAVGAEFSVQRIEVARPDLVHHTVAEAGG